MVLRSCKLLFLGGGDLLAHTIYLSCIVIDRLTFFCSRETIISVDVATVRTLGRVDIFLALRESDIPLLVVYPSGHVSFLFPAGAM